MKKVLIEIIAGAAAACILFMCCVLIIGDSGNLCLVKKFAYSTLMTMPLGAVLGINFADRFLYSSVKFTFVGTLAGLAFTMIVLLLALFIIAIVPAVFFALPILVSTAFLAGHKLGPKMIEMRRQGIFHRAID